MIVQSKLDHFFYKKSIFYKFEFNKLPSEIFEKIFEYLPLKNQCRIERVNKLFQKISHKVVSKTKSIKLKRKSSCCDFGPSLSNLFDLCTPNLEELEIVEDDRDWLDQFVDYRCPKLVKLIVQSDQIDALFGRILKKNRNLKSVKWIEEQCEPGSGLYDDDDYEPMAVSISSKNNVICDRLESLEIHLANNRTFRSFAGRFPNLKVFKILTMENVSNKDFDHFFATCPNLEIFHMEDTDQIDITFSTLEHFWRLNSMKDLRLRHLNEYRFNSSVGDGQNNLQKISACFPLMENLHLKELVHLTNNEIGALAELSHLKNLNLQADHSGMGKKEIGFNIDMGIRRLIDCDHLEKLIMEVKITSATLIFLVRNCRRLDQLYVSKIGDMKTKEEAITVVESFGMGGLIERNIDIHIKKKRYIWNSDEVRETLTALQGDGHVIKIHSPWINICKCF